MSVVAAVAVFAFDYCLTFCSEVEYVWGTKWEMTRIVFTISRYLPFIASSLTCYDALVNDGCGSFILALDAMYSASIVFAEGILIIRTYALWGRNKRVLFFLLFLAAAFIAGAEVTSRQFKIILPGDSTSAYQFYPSFCAYRSSRNAVVQYGFLMAYEIVLQSMSTWRKFRTYRDVRSRTLNTLYWDGIMYMWWIIAPRWPFIASLLLGSSSILGSVINRSTRLGPSFRLKRCIVEQLILQHKQKGCT
ncbi:hypothetical protein OG21DRAFT_969343 [Imleria badia]|nr:hypothetical protein OG21DRAFT_969343 [Imleria badia]